MKPIRLFIIGLLPLLLSACLEVEQHQGWVNGEYNGKTDNRAEQKYFYGDRLAWMGTIWNRNQLQNEYGRAKAPPAK